MPTVFETIPIAPGWSMIRFSCLMQQGFHAGWAITHDRSQRIYALDLPTWIGPAWVRRYRIATAN